MSSLLRGTRFFRFRGLSGLQNGPVLASPYSGVAEPIREPETPVRPILLDLKTRVALYRLPALPPAFPSSPITPGLTQEDFLQYIKPLYKRTWEIDSRRKFTVGSDGQVCNFRPTWLNRKYEFATPIFALEFFKKFVSVLLEENVRLYWSQANIQDTDLALQHIPITFGIDSNTLFIHTATPGVERFAKDDLVYVPTYRDIRVAFRAESIFERALAGGEALPTVNRYTEARNPNLGTQFRIAQPLAISDNQFNSEPAADATPVPIPTPPAPKKILITDTDFSTYLAPLYSHGWHFNFVSRRPADEGGREIAPRLAKRIPFKDFDSAVSFMQTAAEAAVPLTVCDIPILYPTIINTNTLPEKNRQSDFMTTVTDNVVHVYTTTNMGLHFGITHLDINLAIRVENLLQGEYADSIYTGPDPLKPASLPQPTSVTELEKIRVETPPHARKRRTTIPERST